MNDKRHWIGIALGIAVLGAGFLYFTGWTGGGGSNGVLANRTVTLYKSPTCQCCKKYAAYLEETGDAEITNIDRMSMPSIKRKYGVPRKMEACHTSIVGGYVVEGHVPLEAIKKLLTEKPDIAGIALPNMPNGSPGMSGLKTERFQIFAIQHDGSYVPYMTL